MTADNNASPSDHDTPTATMPDSPERRAALEKLAVLSAWTIPTTLMLLRSKRASAESIPNTPNWGDPPPESIPGAPDWGDPPP